MEISKNSLIRGILFAIIGLMGIFKSIDTFRTQYYFYQLKTKGIVVTGKVVTAEKVSSGDTGDGWKHKIDFRTASGEDVFIEVVLDETQIFWPMDSAKLTYVPESPKKAVLLNNLDREFQWDYFVATAMLLMLPIGVFFLLQARMG